MKLVGKFVSVLLLMAVFISIYFFLTKKTITTSKNIPIDKKTENSQYDKDWLEYVNDKFAYKLKYHQDWHKQEDNEPPYPPPPFTMTFSRKFPDGKEWCDFQISLSEGKDSHSGEIESIRSTGQDKESSETIGMINAIKFQSSKGSSSETIYYLNHGNNAIRIGYSFLTNGANQTYCEEIMKKMLTSIEFF